MYRHVFTFLLLWFPLFLPLAAGAQPALSLDSNLLDFGTIKQGSIVKHVFSFTNTGNQDLVLQQVKPSCGCTTPTYTREAVKPGQQGSIEVKFNSAGKLGPQNKTITVITNEGPDKPTLLVLRGDVVAPTIQSGQ